MNRKLIALIVSICLMLAYIPAAEAASQPVVIQLTIGSPAVKVNGETLKVQKPFQVKGTTMVPLGIITKAFGAGLQLNGKTIKLSYNSTVVVLTIGSKKVSVNGKVTSLAVEPKLVNNVTMVPLRVIAESFGAAISASGNVVSIVGFKAGGGASSAAGGSNTNGINPDAGKTKVGDSYYGWSVNYPSDLSLSHQSDNGDYNVWADGEGNPGLIVIVDNIGEEYTREELRDYVETNLFDDSEFVIEKKSIKVDGVDFEKIVSRNRGGWYFEYRVTQKDQRIYVISSGVKSSSRDALNRYSALLDSFKLSFDKSDKSLKDITKVKDGYMSVTDKDYGLTVQLPITWERDKDASYPVFASKDEIAFMDFTISSAKQGETAEQWIKNERKKLEQTFAPGYLRNVSESKVKIGSGEALVLNSEYSFDQKHWLTSHDVLFVSGQHKYMVSFFYSNEQAAVNEAVYKQMIATLTIDTEYVDKNFSEIDETDDLDGQTVTKTSKKYGYSIALPESWTGVEKDFEKDLVFYGNSFGYMIINVADDVTVADFNQSLGSYFQTDEDMKKAGATVKNTTNMTINGVNVTKVEAELPNMDKPLNKTFYLYEHNGKLYILEFDLYKSKDTETARKKIEEVLNSFKFTS